MRTFNHATIALAALTFGLSGCSGSVAPNGGDPRTEVTSHETGQLTKRFRAQAPNVIFFDFDKANLDAAAKARLDKQARWIGRNPRVMFALVGHTDKVGGNSYNQKLGMRRAETALDYLVSKGIERRRLVAMISKGETQPLVLTEDKERMNRRVTTEVIGLLRDNSSGGPLAQADEEAPRPSALVGSSNDGPTASFSRVSVSNESSSARSAAPSPAPSQSVSTSTNNTTSTSEPSTPTTTAPTAPTEDTGNLRPNNGKGNGSEGTELDPGRSGKTKAANND